MSPERFEQLWRRCAAAGGAAPARPVFDDLLARYTEPHRRYHTPEHIDHCLGQHDLAAARMAEPDAVEMALWFHDAIYRIGAVDNEWRSADLFVERAGGHMHRGFVERVAHLIVITEHQDLPEDGDDGYMVDIDLSSMGMPWEQFRRDSDAVREECAEFSDAEFYPRQRRFLESLLAREALYGTEFFRARYERTARANIRRYLDEIDVFPGA